MKIAEIKKRENELIRLYSEAKEASKTFAEAVQYTALQAEARPAVVQRYIVALASEKANIAAHEAEQRVMLFNALPTVMEPAAEV